MRGRSAGEAEERPVSRWALGALLAAGAIAAAAPSAPAVPEAQVAGEARVIGHSVQGRPITAVQLGDPAAERIALVVGMIHGDERAGLRIADRVARRAAELQGVQLWLIRSVNPDGASADERKNAHGVDLNRNFPFRWRDGIPRSSGYYPGPGPASEPETRAVIDFVREIKPEISIWYHQPWGAVLACRGRPAAAARYAKLVRMRTSCRGKGLRGTVISWENAEMPGTAAFVVELAEGGIRARAVRRHAGAAIAVAEGG
jgi:murein peptide amidase A